jgi:hypothetical protein
MFMGASPFECALWIKARTKARRKGESEICFYPLDAKLPIWPHSTLTVDVGSAAWPGVTNLATVSNAGDRNTSNDLIGDPTAVGPEM